MNPTIIKSPSQCSKKELEEFERVLRLPAASYGKWEEGLPPRILSAEYLLYIPDDCNRFIAITAMKWPEPEFKEKIFRLSKSPLSPDDYDLESGWAYVMPEFRKQGIASKIIGMVASAVGNRHTIYATAHVENVSRGIIEKHGFIQSGDPFPSTLYEGEEVLYVQPPGSSWDGKRFS